ncbi:hypothetical protein BC835DRAFT_1290948 [Cytidiella melzeri]|nr:hypothetical protein BC835DRAFT_1290948 [Cytidiella melzeri]
MRQLPPLKPFHPDDSEEVHPQSVHFTKDGEAVIVSYLSDGIRCWDVETRELLWTIKPRSYIGRTSVSGNGLVLVASNLYDGFDCYDLQSRAWFHTFCARITRNLPLPIEFIHEDKALLLGSPCGDVTIWELESHNWLDSLRHTGM